MKKMFSNIIFLLFLCLSCSRNSTEPKQSLPDLVIQNITYSLSYSGGIGFTVDTLLITNIGQADFYGYLHVSEASEKYYQQMGLFNTGALVYCGSTPDSILPGRISPGETIRGIMGTPIPTDTSVVRFHIQTDTKGTQAGEPSPPLYTESNYDNNDYLLTITH